MLKKIKPNLSVVSHFVSKRTKNGNCEGKVLLVCNGKLAGERKKELAKKTGVPSMELFDLKAALDHLKQLGSSARAGDTSRFKEREKGEAPGRLRQGGEVDYRGKRPGFSKEELKRKK